MNTKVRSETPIQEWTRRCQDKLHNKKWFPWAFEAVEGGILCTGAECPLYTEGPKRGLPNYNRPAKGTERTVLLKSPVHKGRILKSGEAH